MFPSACSRAWRSAAVAIAGVWLPVGLLAHDHPAMQVGNEARSATSAPAQADRPAGRIELLLQEAFRLYDQDQLDNARKLFEQALALATEEKNVRAEAESHRGLGIILYERAEYASARSEFELALTLFERLPDRAGVAKVTTHLAGVAQMTGDVKEARERYRRALAEYESLGDRRGQARVLLGLTYWLGLDVAEEQSVLERGLVIAKELGEGRLEASFLHQWGDALFTRDDYAGAQDKLEQAAALLEKLGARSELARVLTSLGRVQRAHGYPERALLLYQRALAIQDEIGDRQGVIQSINAIAVTYGLLHKPREAIEQYQRALALAEQTGSARLRTFQLGNLAAGYLRNGDWTKAAEILVIVVTEEKDTRVLSTRYSHLGEAYFYLRRYERALEMVEKSDKLLGPEPDSRRGNLYLKAQIERKMGRTSDAVADVRESLRLIEELRSRLVPTDFMKRGFGDWFKETFSISIGLLYESGHQADAFEAAERARSRAFLDLLGGRNVRLKASAQSKLADVHELQNTLTAMGVESSDIPPRAPYALPSRGEDSELAALRERWQKADPQIRSLVSVTPFSLREAASVTARLRSTLLSYWVGPDTTWIWAIGPDGLVRSAHVEVTAARITELVQATFRQPDATFLTADRGDHVSQRAILGTRGGDLVVAHDSQRQAWRELYRILIRPIRAALPPRGRLLTIEPHGPLFRLSFAALLDENGTYLIEKYPLHYTPAAAVLQFTATSRKSDQAGRFLLVADPSLSATAADSSPLPPLPGARREVQAIARLLQPGAATVLAGAEATEERFRSLLNDKTVIHLATHGIIRDDQPLDSFLALGASGSGDGRLTAQSIYGLDLQADLVVLSACRSGLGKISGDGIVGLARAFFYAGTSSVVATLWDVADEPAGRMMPQFYRALIRLPHKSRALRAAQLQLLRDLRAGRVRVATADGEVVLPEHPLFWAAYVLLGEP